MPAKPTVLPEWASGGTADIVQPTLGEKQDGWDTNDRPPAQYFNWWQNLVYQWAQYLDAPVGTGSGPGLAATGGSTSGTGFAGTGGGPNGKGMTGQGTGSGSGGEFTGGATGIGLKGIGGSTSGNGVLAQADTGAAPVNSALRVVPQQIAPSSPSVGGIYSHQLNANVQAKLSHWSGYEWDRLVSQVFCKDTTADNLTGLLNVETAFATTWTHKGVTSSSLRKGSTLRVRGVVERTSSGTLSPFTVYVRLGRVATALTVRDLYGEFRALTGDGMVIFEMIAFFNDPAVTGGVTCTGRGMTKPVSSTAGAASACASLNFQTVNELTGGDCILTVSVAGDATNAHDFALYALSIDVN